VCITIDHDDDINSQALFKTLSKLLSVVDVAEQCSLEGLRMAFAISGNNIHLTVCQERLQKLKVIDVECAAIGAVYQALTKIVHNSRRPFSSRIVRENCDDDSNRNIQILYVYYYYYYYYNSFI